MEIFLVKIHERADKTLYIERKVAKSTAQDYIAISHVWGDPATIETVPIDGFIPVQLSPGKRNILSILHRSDVCGKEWFWMDLFCIDQRSESPISITDQLMAIPEIYKSSRVVKILLEAPVCTTWAEIGSRIAIKDTDEIEIGLFNEEERRHSRKCPNMMLRDPWFDRLWTRQEGLYAMNLQVVVLNPVPCARLATLRIPGDRWVNEGHTGLKRAAVDAFVVDKLAYHGITTQERKMSFRVYVDLVYKNSIRVGDYGGAVGPSSSYSPFGEAWRSGRQTTKPRDYVLAVFPDIPGYRAPTAARMTFEELLLNAFEQLERPGQLQTYYILPKTPESMVMNTAMERGSRQPWITE